MANNGTGDVRNTDDIPPDSNYPPVLPVATADERLQGRFHTLRAILNEKFKKEPNFYIQVPGRVNIIGEHIDYCGYGVLPLAIQQDMILAVSVDNSCKENRDMPFLYLTNREDKYPDFKCPINNISIQKPPSWHDYFLCGVYGILCDIKEEYLSESKGEREIGNMYVAVHGTVPPCSGLSSSSALVSAATLATAHALKLKLSKLSLASIAARTERNVGTEGGGMDQAIAFLATKGCAKFIDFQPLRCHDVRLPKDAAFVIAHSLVTINKAAGSEYNTRVVECRLAAQVIAKHEGYEWKNMRRLEDLEKILPKNTSKLDGLKHLLTLVEKLLHEEAYTKEEILLYLGINEEELVKSSLSANTTHLKTFKLKQRAAHVYSEAMRVLEFEQECLRSQKEDFTGDKSVKTLERLGMLMNSSHSSLRDLYECSHPQMDLLVEICQEKCFGARLTGAGWGGCAVALTTEAAADEFVKHLKKKFYIGQKGFKEDDDFQSVIFLTSLNSGASIYSVKYSSSDLSCSQDSVIGNHSNGV